MLKKLIYIILFFCFVAVPPTVAQEQPVNSYDSHGKRHGYWKIYYDDNEEFLKLEGEFSHGQEIGMFKFYKEGLEHPTAVMEFDPASDTVKGKYLSQDGEIVSEGNFLDQQRVGLWTYYHEVSDKVMMTENYTKGLINGPRIVYYPNGEIAEKAEYLDGKLHGEFFMYSETGIILEHLSYVRGELHGPAKFYNGKGELVTEGNYKRDMHHGIWNYYQNGKLKEQKDYSK